MREAKLVNDIKIAAIFIDWLKAVHLAFSIDLEVLLFHYGVLVEGVIQ